MKQRDYIHGSAARVIEVPSYNNYRNENIKDKSTVLKPSNQKQKEQQELNRALHTEHNQRVFMLMLSVAILSFAMVMCVSYLKVISMNQVLKDETMTMETSYSELKENNDNQEHDINANVNLTELYKVATEDMGMIYPTKSQIKYYEAGESQYVVQYQDIPSAK